MSTKIRSFASFALAGTIALAATTAAEHHEETTAMSSFYDLEATTLAGDPQPLSAYAGTVVLVVNTASECGFTPQYAGLQKLHADYADRGFSVLGFPSNDFGGQEPGTHEQIAEFSSKQYGVTFPMMAKVQTKGDGQSPVYRFLSADHPAPKWNFHKYLIGKDGRVAGSFESGVTPESDELRTAIDAALAQ